MKWLSFARERWVVLLGLGLAAALLVASSTLLPVQAGIAALGTKLQALGAVGAVLFAAIYILGAMALVPIAGFSFVAGLIYGAFGLALAWVSVMIAAAISFPLARRFLAPRVERLIASRRLLRTVTAVIDEEGWRMVLLVRLSGMVPFGVQNYVFGVTRVGFLPFWLATTAGVLPSIVLYGGAGVAGNAAVMNGEVDPLRLVFLGSAAAASLALVVLTARKVRARLAAERSRETSAAGAAIPSWRRTA